MKNTKLSLIVLLTIFLVSLFTIVTVNAQGRLETYVGSETCLVCHTSLNSEIVEKWSNSQHGNFTGNASPVSRGIGCAGCHSTNYDPATNTYTEARQGCEVCHGPGQTHAGGPSEENIYSPEDSHVCGQCHNRNGQSLTYTNPETNEPVGYPVGYTPDQNLDEYYQSASLDDLHSFWPSGHASYSHGGGGMQYPEWIQTGHSDSGIECFDCHDPHGSVGNPDQLVEPENNLCVECHTVQEQMNAGTGGEGVPDMPWVMDDMCVGCHMPPVGITHAGTPGDGRSHLFRVLEPEQAEEYSQLSGDVEHPPEQAEEHIHIPASSCTECHVTDDDYFATRFQGLMDERRSEASSLVTSLMNSLAGLSYSTSDAQTLVDMAETNVNLVDNDESRGWHNYYYAASLLGEADQLIDRADTVEEYVTTNNELEAENEELSTQVSNLQNQVNELQAEVDDLSQRASSSSTNLIIGAVVGLVIGAVAVYFLKRQ